MENTTQNQATTVKVNETPARPRFWELLLRCLGAIAC